jgi:hypothetical protein
MTVRFRSHWSMLSRPMPWAVLSRATLIQVVELNEVAPVVFLVLILISGRGD